MISGNEYETLWSIPFILVFMTGWYWRIISLDRGLTGHVEEMVQERFIVLFS